MHRAWWITVLVACENPAASPSPSPSPSPSSPSPSPSPIPIDAVTVDALVDAPPSPSPPDALAPPDALVTAEWPTAIESEQVEVNRAIGQYKLVLSYPRLRTRPPALGKQLSAEIAKGGEPGFDPKRHHGQLDYSCERRVVNRLVVILACSRMQDARTLAEAAQGVGGAPAGPDRYPYAVWLQPALPPIAVGDLAPGIDIAAVLASAPADCREHCTYTADRFVIDDDGAIRFVPAGRDGSYCERPCDDDAPRIELDRIKPTHPWAQKLDAWIRQRLAAGESLVK